MWLGVKVVRELRLIWFRNISKFGELSLTLFKQLIYGFISKYQ